MLASMEPRGQGPIAAIEACAHELLDGYAPGQVALLCPDGRGGPTLTYDELAHALCTLRAIGAPAKLLRSLELTASLPGRVACVVWGSELPVLRLVELDDLRARVCAEGETAEPPDPTRGDVELAVADAEDRVARLDTQIAVLQAARWGRSRIANLREARKLVRRATSTLGKLTKRSGLERKEACGELSATLAEMRQTMLDFEGLGVVGRPLRADQPAAIDVACREVFRILEPRMKATGLMAQLDVPDLPLLPLDAGVVRAVLFSLIVNATHSCRAGAAVVVHARLVAGGAQLELHVADTGAGTTVGVSPREGGPLFMTERSESGIALARSAAEEAGGSLKTQSVVDGGMSVTLRVPVA